MTDDRPALVVVDVQRGFDDTTFWGPRDNPSCEANVVRLVERWRREGLPLVLIRHDSQDPASPLHPSSPGNAFKDGVDGPSDLLVVKSVNSAFHGEPDLDTWLRGEGITSLVVCGITTNHCCETTARVGGNLGYDVTFVLDACHTFDRRDPYGQLVPAAELARITATNLHGEFATVRTTADVLA
ncbi:cysteine hydrolase family protein [Aeromicrobium massiliense]|uniref:cysteine hydrolase family protein n=1 Tax=Aeromicrobium massiliense TaxID=1464554 RepID=UPI0005788DF3|nr:cysteine hydrolase family protein [Aeromicrobium massiliense]